MSNEKPVRITVGDVKEVTEATTIQADTVKPVSTQSVSSMPRPAMSSNAGNGVVVIGGIVGLVLVIIAGILGLGASPEPAGGAAKAAISNNAPAGSTSSAPAANNTATATDTPAATNEPAATNTPEANAPAGTNTPAATNEPAANNTPAGNNAPK